eukprot:TRINITY_DN3790_c0_g1_i8.p1 TRINITY_DN3790_c0_g1~~TRINITY_DN3790_c0_g1_i8.p1  ORF type:complete len:227 (+),score=53.12 TRINITY_DN3790_c0_g1_i8:30-683(+)
MSGKATVELFYDVVSPYSYFAFETLIRLEPVWGFRLVLTPAFLGGVLQGSGNKTPVAVVAKEHYFYQDIARCSKQFGVRITPNGKPNKFPISSLANMRTLVWIQEKYPNKLMTISRAFWEMYWGQGLDISTAEAIQQIMVNGAITTDESVHWKEAIKSSEVKQKLMRNTQRALDTGAFGLPWMLVTKAGEVDHQVLFGSDRFAHLAMMLDQDFPAKL